MPSDHAVKHDVINRLRSVRGHLDGVLRMVESDAYCIDIMQQVQAVQSALAKVNVLMLDDHMHACVFDAIRSEDVDERERVLGELRDVYAKRSQL
jgi:DNA-binding FrmR family transcriptional regulator